MKRHRFWIVIGCFVLLLVGVWFATPPTFAKKVKQAGIVLVRIGPSDPKPNGGVLYKLDGPNCQKLIDLLKREGFPMLVHPGTDTAVYEFSKDSKFLFFFHRKQEVEIGVAVMHDPEVYFKPPI
ncbi:MAG: hypothetical protein WCG75_08660 [Armatimonadota bacterium]